MRTPNRVARDYQNMRVLRLGKIARLICSDGCRGSGVVSVRLIEMRGDALQKFDAAAEFRSFSR
jgi:hypothetical protein